MSFEAVIGLEIHAQLNTKSKIFSTESTGFEAGDNENTSVVSCGFPGALPVLNKKVIELSVLTGLALGCTIRRRSVFARKNYFYPDLPKGYQISQYDQPICENGALEYSIEGATKSVSIHRAHIEEDAGKSTHFGDYTLINYNRSGVPLLEIVSGPDMRSPTEAAEYAKALRQVLRYLDVCDGNLEQGSLRCDCNISVRPIGQERLGTKVEIKNINSFRFIEKALEYEFQRQVDCVQRGEPIVQETRLWDPDKNRTFSMRAKEDAQDYRYFPDPDLLPVIVSDQMIDLLGSRVPELPLVRQKRFESQYGLSLQDAQNLTSEKDLADFYEEVVRSSGYSRSSANWILSELLRELHLANLSVRQSPVSAKNLGRLVELVESRVISGKIGKTVFAEMWFKKTGPDEIIKASGLVQMNEPKALEKMIDEILEANQNQVIEYRAGKTKILGFFVGAVMKASRGQANPELLNKLLLEKLKGSL